MSVFTTLHSRLASLGSSLLSTAITSQRDADIGKWDAQGTSTEDAEDREKPLPLLPAIQALQAAWQSASAATVTNRAQALAQALQEALQPGVAACGAMLMQPALPCWLQSFQPASQADPRFYKGCTVTHAAISLLFNHPLWLYHQVKFLYTN